MKSISTCVGLLKLGRFSFCAQVRFLASGPDKKQHNKYTDHMSEKLVSRIQREKGKRQTEEHAGFEMDPMEGLVSTYEQARYERHRMRRSIFMKKYAKEAPETNLLTWQAKQQIIYLCTKENWSPYEVAESFPISAKNVQKLLHNKNQNLTPSEIVKHDKRIVKKWQRLLEAGQNLGRGPVDPELKEIVESDRLKLLHNAAGAANLPVPVKEVEEKQENNHLDMYTFHYIDAGMKARELKKKSRFDGQLIKMYRLFNKDPSPEHSSEEQVVMDKISQEKDQTSVIEKEAEKLKLLQALARNYEYKEDDDREEEYEDLLKRQTDSLDENDDYEDDNESFQNEWFAPLETKHSR